MQEKYKNVKIGKTAQNRGKTTITPRLIDTNHCSSPPECHPI
jgi:hypothetical protein